MQDEVKKIWDEWEAYQSYLNTKNYPKTFKQNTDFYEGRQWDLKNHNVDIPPVTVNHIRPITDIKTANILSTPFSVSFNNGNEDSEIMTIKLNNFDKAILKELNHDVKNRYMVNSNAIKGVFAIHYYWSEDKDGIRGLYKGGLEAEVINPLWVAVSNPNEKDIQKMEWVTIGTPMKVNKVKKMAKDMGLSAEEIEKIKADDLDTLIGSEDARNQDSSDDSKKQCVVLTKMFRQNGEVWVQKLTKNVMLGKPRCLNPLVAENKIKKELEKFTKDKYKTDPEKSPIQDTTLENETGNDVWNLYPIEMASLTPSDNSIYGLSDVSDLIMLQKMLNISFATGYKNSLDNVFPKYLAKEGALQQEITGEPNEVITDHYKGSSWGVQKLEGIPLSNAQVGLPQTIIEFMKTVSNSRDVLQGDSVGANMSATAIQSLQVQAEKPIAQQRELFMQSLKRMAEIRLLFYKFYYHKKQFAYDLDDIDYENELEGTGYGKDAKIVNRTKFDIFDGKDYRGTSFFITTSVGRGTKYDAITAQETLNNLYLNGNIDKMDSDKLEQYILALDDNIFPYKDNLRKLMRKQRQSEKAQLTAENQQLTQALQESQIQIQKLQIYIKSLGEEYTNKINVQNEMIKQRDAMYQKANDTINQIYMNVKKQ